MALEQGVRAQMLLRACLLMSMLACLCVNDSSQDETNSVLNQQTSITNSEETHNIGNKLTNNYRFQENNYQPSQSTQVVLNVGKLAKKKLRKTRPPSLEEVAIKQRIIEVYEQALGEVARSSEQVDVNKLTHLKHLGRILESLNPKYIATERVMYQAFSDPSNPGRNVVPPEIEALMGTNDSPDDTDTSQQLEPAATNGQVVEPLQFSGSDKEEPVSRQLDQMADLFKRTVRWDKAFVQRLFQLSDAEVTPQQLAFKRLVQCIDYPLFCNKPEHGFGKGRKAKKFGPKHRYAEVLETRVSWPTKRPEQQVSQPVIQDKQTQSVESIPLQRQQSPKQQLQQQQQQQPRMQRQSTRSDGPPQAQPTYQRNFAPGRMPQAAQQLEAASPDHESYVQQQRYDVPNEYVDDGESRQKQWRRRRPEDDEHESDIYVQPPPRATIHPRWQPRHLPPPPPLQHTYNRLNPGVQRPSMPRDPPMAPHTRYPNRGENAQQLRPNHPIDSDSNRHWSRARPAGLE